MTLRRGLGLALLVIAGLCAVLVMTAACARPTSCARAVVWPLVGAVGGGLAAVVLVAAVGRCTALVRSVARELDELAVDRRPPMRLTAIAAGLGLTELGCVASNEPVAFTGGALRPRVWVSRALDSLDEEAVTAILAHEAHHARRRDPLRRAVRRSLADVVVVAPVLRWWAEWSAEREELAADRAALRVTSPSALAGALLVVGGGGEAVALAAFDGAADARLAQLLGDPPPARRCPWHLLVASAAGVFGVGAAALCASQLLAMYA